ncbi:MAG TPA: SIMPL domain-containing protein [Symbiobacteriaceae bacterium]|nr:SIMPL domain-containing protein [Symbiobacteriaceae bacterium]
MKPQHFAALVGALLVAAAILLFAGRPDSGKADSAAVTPPPRLVTVTGEGEVRVKPDLVLVTFGYITHRASAAEAEALTVASAGQIAAALTQAGADETRTEVSHLTLTTDTYQDFTGTTRISGFKASVTVQAALKNPAKVSDLLTAGLAAGATSVENVVYTIENAESSKQAAMRAALENARQRAAVITKAEGEALGALQSVEVLTEEAPPAATSPGALTFKSSVKAVFQY